MMSQWASAARPAAAKDEPIEDKIGRETMRDEPQSCGAASAGRKHSCQPRLQYIAVGGRCTHIAKR